MSLLDVSVRKLLNKEVAIERQSSRDDHNSLFAQFTFLESLLFFNSVAVVYCTTRHQKTMIQLYIEDPSTKRRCRVVLQPRN